jgi:hypothetical protein
VQRDTKKLEAEIERLRARPSNMQCADLIIIEKDDEIERLRAENQECHAEIAQHQECHAYIERLRAEIEGWKSQADSDRYEAAERSYSED